MTGIGCWATVPTLCARTRPQMHRGGRENTHGYVGAARSARITASDVEQVMQTAAPSHRTRSSAKDGARDSWTRAAEVGDTVQWDGAHSSVRAGSLEANASHVGGIVEAVEDGFVLVARPTGRGHSTEPYQVPKAALTSRSTGRARLCSPPPQAQRPKRQRASSGSTPSSVVKDGDTMAAASAASTASTASVWKLGGSQEDMEGELHRLWEETRQLREENQKLKKQKRDSKAYHKTKTAGAKKPGSVAR